jgi:hypothetical protein
MSLHDVVCEQTNNELSTAVHCSSLPIAMEKMSSKSIFSLTRVNKVYDDSGTDYRELHTCNTIYMSLGQTKDAAAFILIFFFYHEQN